MLLGIKIFNVSNCLSWFAVLAASSSGFKRRVELILRRMGPMATEKSGIIEYGGIIASGAIMQC
jgi:hypothetical protein